MQDSSERRDSDRLEPPTCERCGTAAAMEVAVRVEYAVYFRCQSCGTITSRLKPFEEAYRAKRA
jgi:uncharacterized Zn finger protein